MATFKIHDFKESANVIQYSLPIMYTDGPTQNVLFLESVNFFWKYMYNSKCKRIQKIMQNFIHIKNYFFTYMLKKLFYKFCKLLHLKKISKFLKKFEKFCEVFGKIFANIFCTKTTKHFFIWKAHPWI